MKFKFTKKQIEELHHSADLYRMGWTDERKQRIEEIRSTGGYKRCAECCFFGPFSASEILQDIPMNKNCESIDYIAALEDLLGISTKMVYDGKKNSYSVKTPNDGDKLVYDEKDVELGLWDKICAFFHIETEHSKKVAFAKKSIEVQKEKLDTFNKDVVKRKRGIIIGQGVHIKFRNHNEYLVKEAENIESGFKQLFFGDEAVEDYTFKNGDKLSALAACIAMYHQEGGKDLANMSLKEINKPENDGLRMRLKAIGDEYKTIISEKGLDEKIKHADDFLMTSDKYSTRDKVLLSRIATDREFKVEWDKVELDKKLKYEEQRKELTGAKVYTMFKVKGELRKVIGKEFPDGKKNGFYEVTEKDLKNLEPFKDAREYKLCVDELEAENYMKAAEHLGRLTDKKELEGLEMKPENYNEFIIKAEKLIERREYDLSLYKKDYMDTMKDRSEEELGIYDTF